FCSTRKCQTIHHCPYGACAWIDPVDLGKRFAAGMMVDVDREEALQPGDACALKAIALQHDRYLMVSFYRDALLNAICERQRLIEQWHGITQDSQHLLSPL